MSFGYNATNVKPTTFELLEKGWRLLKIDAVQETVSKRGHDQVLVTFKVEEGNDIGRRLPFHNVTFLPEGSKGAGIAIHFLKCIGQPYEGKLRVTPSDWVGAMIYGYVDIDLEYDRNKIKMIKSCEEFEASIEKKNGSPKTIKELKKGKPEDAIKGPSNENPKWLQEEPEVIA